MRNGLASCLSYLAVFAAGWLVFGCVAYIAYLAWLAYK